MDFLIVLVVATVAVFALRNPIKKAPVVFYLLAIAAVVLLFLGSNGMPGSWWKPAVLLVQRCMVALALFAIVMFVGVLPEGSKAKSWLRPIRAEISVVAWILCLGHMCVYAVPYARRAVSGAMETSMLLSICIAAILFVLLLLLGITSFDFVKRRISGGTWKSIQRWSYPFFALVFAHLLFMLAPAALRGGEQAQTSIAVYVTMFVAYVVLRLYRAYKERPSGESGGSDGSSCINAADAPSVA